MIHFLPSLLLNGGMMFTNLFFALLLFFPSISFAWNQLKPGLEYQRFPVSSNPPATIHVFKIDPRKYKFRPIISSFPTTRTAQEMVEESHALLAINANFFDGLGHPLGLVIQDSKTKNPFKNISWWGIFQVDRGQPKIIHSTEYRAHGGIQAAIQAGPRLVIHGMIPVLKPTFSPKTALGINKQGKVLFMVTQGLLQAQDFAALLAQPETLGGLGCIEALNLDGGSSTQAYAKIGTFELNVPSFVKVPVGLGVYRK